MQEIHGYPVWLAETFVDPSRFAGTCYRASNWHSLGRTRGYGRVPGATPNWHYHGQPKEVYVYSLTDDCRDQLCGTAVPGSGRFERPAADEWPSTEELESLHDHLSGMEDFRHARGQRYPLPCLVTLMVAARLAGYRGITAFGQYAALLSQEQLAAVGAFWSPSKARYTAPVTSTFH